MRKYIFAVVLLAICPLAFAQQVLNNDTVINMVKKGLSDDLIITNINALPGNYDISIDGQMALKSASVSDKVIQAIVVKAASATPAAPAPPPAPPAAPAPPPAPPTAPAPPAPVAPIPPVPPQTNTSALPAGITDVGVYYQDKSGAWTAIPPENVYARLGGLDINPLHKEVGGRNTNGHISGARAQTVVTLPAMVAVYVPEGRTIDDYRLLQLTSKSNERIFPITSGAATVENDELDKNARGFSSKEIAPRVYQLMLSAHLGKGEYGMLSPKPRNASEGKIWKIYCVSVSE